MKKNQLTLMAVTFISGIILGVSVLGLYSFTSKNNVVIPMSKEKKIELKEAKTFFKNYYKNAVTPKEALKGFAINTEQLAAFIELMNENPNLTGFRIYFGNDETEGDVSLVVGVNNSGLDETNTIYKVAARSTGPCPTICDESSGVIAN